MPNHSNALTPHNMLVAYRSTVDPDTRTQIEMFNSMPAPDKMELLFCMFLHMGGAIQRIETQIKPAQQKPKEEKNGGHDTSQPLEIK